MCKYCDNWENRTCEHFDPYPVDNDRVIIFSNPRSNPNDPVLCALYCGGYNTSMLISYCPFCGKKLVI